MAGRVDLQELLALAVRGLKPMFNAAKQQFCYRLVRTQNGLIQEGLSPRYTAMTLLGLHELEKFQGERPFQTAPILDALIENPEWPAGVGDFGVLLWTVALTSPQNLARVFRRLSLPSALDSYADAREKRTMELAWFLTGLCYATLAQQAGVPDLSSVSAKVYQLLVENQGKGGFFGHLGRSASAAGRLRGWLGSFADQVYPTIAFTAYSLASGNKEALQRALDCGAGICRVQGPLGQWWWHYDSRSGRVASMYPVFSVHQEAMGPMALFPLGEAAGRDFSGPIYKGLQWIGGANELGIDMRESDLVWRRIHPLPESSMKVDVALSHFHMYRDASKRKMAILFECRPYELGWLLYAFSAHARDHHAVAG